MRVLITGVAGFIGSHLAEALLEKGVQVYGIDNLTTGRRINVDDRVLFVNGDIRDKTSFDLDEEFDVIYHCAASYKDKDDWEGDASTNVLGTINVIRAAKESGAKIVYFQTSLCYGPNPASPVSLDAPLNPHGSYAVSKTAGEQYIADSGIPYVSLRLANMYGPRNLSGPVPTFYKRITEGKPCVIADARRDFVYIGDLVPVAVAAAKKGHGPYHVSSGTDQSVKDIYLAVVEALGIEPRAEAAFIPRSADDVATLLVDPSETEREFGWKAKVALADGIRSAVGYYEYFGVTETYTHLSLKG